MVGYYSVAEKIVKAMLGILTPVSQAAYPRFSKLAAESKAEALFWGRRMLFLMGGIGFGLSVVIFLSAPLIVGILLGTQYRPSILAIKIISFLPFLVALSNVLGIQLMVPFGMDRGFTWILFTAGLLNVSLAVLLVPPWQAAGMAISVLISEIFVTLAMSIFLIYKNCTLWGKMVRP
jgi:PST family polysaccharide transporter